MAACRFPIGVSGTSTLGGGVRTRGGAVAPLIPGDTESLLVPMWMAVEGYVFFLGATMAAGSARVMAASPDSLCKWRLRAVVEFLGHLRQLKRMNIWIGDIQ